MRDAAAGSRSEMDVLKFYIWLMLVMTVALAAFFWKVWSDLDEVNANLAFGRKSMGEFAQEKREIKGMLDVYTSNKEDVARDAPQTWFSNIWRRCGIPDASMHPGAWRFPADWNVKGKFYEERIDMTFDRRAPLARQAIAQFVHAVEASSTRLRVIELELARTDKEDFEKDQWGGKAVIGYRHAKTD